MKKILVIDLGKEQTTSEVAFLGQTVEVARIGCEGQVDRACDLIRQYDGAMDAIALEGMPATLKLGSSVRQHPRGAMLAQTAKQTPVVDGGGARDWLERWGVILADRAQPGIFAEKRILMVPGLNHAGLADALGRHSPVIRYADPFVFFGMPAFPGVGSKQSLARAEAPTLDQLKDFPFRRLQPDAGHPHVPRAIESFEWADVLAGDIGAIRRYAPAQLKHKTVVVEHANEADVEDLSKRGVSILVTLMPSLDTANDLGQYSAAVVEGLLAALRPDRALPLNENTYLDLVANIQAKPAIRYLRADEVGVNRFAFVIHPLKVDFIHKHKWFHWTKYLPDDLVEAVAAYFPPMYLSRITGAQSPTTGQRLEGFLFSLGGTPRQIMKHNERFTYDRLNQAARMAERKGARIMGLGAFTKVVGDAGITVANEADIAITSGNSLTVAATLESAKQAVVKMGATDLTHGKVMVIGATGAIGSVCARLLAQAIFDVALVSIEPEKLIELKRRIQAETPGARVTIATKTDDLVGDCDLIVSATSAFGERVIDITKCKPGAVICDVASPPDIGEKEAALRPDVLVIESGEVRIPGDIDFGYDIGLPPKVAYACIAEAALLAMEGRFEDYTLGRNIQLERVKEIYHLFKKHQFQLAGLRSFGKIITEEDVLEKQALAAKLRADPEEFARVKREAAVKLAKLPATSKGVGASNGSFKKWAWLGGTAGAVGLAVMLARGRAVKQQRV